MHRLATVHARDNQPTTNDQRRHDTWCELEFLSEGLECYKDTQIEAYDITKLATKLQNSDSRNKIDYFVGGFIGRGYPNHTGLHTVKVIYPMRIVGRRQVTVRFMK